MTVLLKIDQEKAQQHIPVRHRAVLSLEPSLVARSRCVPIGGLKGPRINDLSPLWPASYLRDALLSGAIKWVAAMRKQGFELLTSEASVRVWGPLKPKYWDQASGSSLFVRAHQDGEDPRNAMKADFIFLADFLAGQGFVHADDHEMASAHAGGLYDEALKRNNNDVLRAILSLPQEAQLPSVAAQMSEAMVLERERAAVIEEQRRRALSSWQ